MSAHHALWVDSQCPLHSGVELLADQLASTVLGYWKELDCLNLFPAHRICVITSRYMSQFSRSALLYAEVIIKLPLQPPGVETGVEMKRMLVVLCRCVHA